MPATAVSTAWPTRDVLLPERDDEHGAERHHHAEQHEQQAVERPLERRARVSERARLARDALRVALRADRGDLVRARPLDDERARAHLVARAVARPRSDSPVRIDSSSGRPALATSVPSATTWSPGASRTRSPTTTSSTCSCRGSAVPHDRRVRRDERGEPVERPLGAQLLRDPDRGVRDDDRRGRARPASRRRRASARRARAGSR